MTYLFAELLHALQSDGADGAGDSLKITDYLSALSAASKNARGGFCTPEDKEMSSKNLPLKSVAASDWPRLNAAGAVKILHLARRVSATHTSSTWFNCYPLFQCNFLFLVPRTMVRRRGFPHQTLSLAFVIRAALGNAGRVVAVHDSPAHCF